MVPPYKQARLVTAGGFQTVAGMVIILAHLQRKTGTSSSLSLRKGDTDIMRRHRGTWHLVKAIIKDMMTL